MRILCTGSAGFIGSHLVDALVGQGHGVIGVDNMSGGFKRNLNPEAINYRCDLFDTNHVMAIMGEHKPDVVYHLAADATEGRSQFTPISATRNNFMASVNVFTAAIKHGVKRIVFTSSASVYGDQPTPFHEAMEPRPVDIYGINKAATEKVLEVLAKVHGFDYVILRAHNVFGERQNISDAYRNVVGIFMNRLMQGSRLIIYGDGEQVRAFTYIDNIIPCFVRALQAPSGLIANVGPEDTQTVNELAVEVLKSMGVDKPGMIKYVPERPQEVKHAHCTVGISQRVLGYKTKVGFSEGIKRMAKWAKKLGYQPFRYQELEITNAKTPTTWSKHEL